MCDYDTVIMITESSHFLEIHTEIFIMKGYNEICFKIILGVGLGRQVGGLQMK